MIENYHIDNIEAFVGRGLGTSNWFRIDQGRIDAFGAATYDPDPQHDDPAWAGENSPYGGTIAYGFQTLSLLSHLTRASGLQPAGVGFALNYGMDRVRFLAPVPVGTDIRCHSKLIRVTPKSEGVWILKTENTVEIKGKDNPALIAEWLFLCAADGVDPATI